LFFDNSIVPNFSDDSISQAISEFTAFYGHNPSLLPTYKTSSIVIPNSVTEIDKDIFLGMHWPIKSTSVCINTNERKTCM
jgi:hypothetical protein